MPAATGRTIKGSGGPSPLSVRALDRTIDGMNLIGSGLIVLLVAIIGSDIAMRNLFNRPVSGVPEIVALSIVAIVFLQLPYTVRAGRLTRSDALLSALQARRPGTFRALNVTFDVMAVVMAGLILRFSWPLMDRAIRDDLFIGAQGTFTAPLWPVRVAVVAATAVLVLQLLRQIAANVAGPVPPQAGTAPL